MRELHLHLSEKDIKRAELCSGEKGGTHTCSAQEALAKRTNYEQIERRQHIRKLAMINVTIIQYDNNIGNAKVTTHEKGRKKVYEACCR